MLKIYLFAFTAFFFLSFHTINAQDENPVRWTVKKTYAGDNEFIIDFIAEIDTGWFMYGQVQNKKLRPLILNLSTPHFMSLSGELRATTAPLTTPTLYFEEYYYAPHYKNTVAFRQRIKIDKPEANPYTSGQVRFGAYKSKGKNTQRHQKCYCFYFDLTDLSEEEIVLSTECAHQFDFCAPKARQRQEWFILKLSEQSPSHHYVDWDFFYKKNGKNRFQIIAEADIQNSYRLITSQDTTLRAGLLFDFSELRNCAPSNFATSAPPAKSPYLIWKKELDYVTGKVRLTYDVEIDEDVSWAFVLLNIRYMICDDLICFDESYVKVKFPLKEPQNRTIYVSVNRNVNQDGDAIIAKEIEE